MPCFVKQQVGMVQNEDKARIGKHYEQEENPRADQKADQFGLRQNVPLGSIHFVVQSWICAVGLVRRCPRLLLRLLLRGPIRLQLL